MLLLVLAGVLDLMKTMVMMMTKTMMMLLALAGVLDLRFLDGGVGGPVWPVHTDGIDDDIGDDGIGDDDIIDDGIGDHGIGDDETIDDGIGDDDYHDDDGGYELWVDLDLSDHFILIILVMVKKHTRYIIVMKMINDDDDDKSGRVLKDQKEDWIHPQHQPDQTHTHHSHSSDDDGCDD